MRSSLLIVDDFPETMNILGELYSMDGRDVRTASSGAEAIAQVMKYPSSIIWIDMDVHNFKATDLASHLKAACSKHHARQCITIAVSGLFLPNEVVDLPGFDHLFIKPIDFEKFDALLARYDAQQGQVSG